MRLGIGLGLSGQRGASGPSIVLSTPSQQEGTAIGTTIGTLSVVGASTGSSGWTFAKTVDPDAAFTLTTATVKNAIVFDYDVTTGGATSHIATYTATKAGDPASPITTQIRVAVTNDISDDPTVPAAPTLTATAGDGQVTLSWVDGSNGGSAITAHKLYRGTVSGTLTLIGTIMSGSPYVDTGLTNGQAYYYKLSAVNAIGEGAFSAEQSATAGYVTPAVTKAAVEGCSFDDATTEPLAYAAINTGLSYQIFAIGGSSFANMTSRLGDVDTYNPDLALVGGSGPNDLGSTSVSASDYLSAQNTYLTSLKALLPSGTPIGVPGLPPIKESLNAAYAGYNVKRKAVNAANRAAVGGGLIDFYMPRYEHPVTGFDGAALDTALMSDGVHPGGQMNLDGQATCLAAIQAIKDQAGQAPATNPSAFTIPDVTSAPVSTLVSSRFVVQGLGMGQTATCAVVSGSAYIARGYATDDTTHHATASTPFTVMCGDVVTVTMMSSASNETGVSSVIAIGDKSDTFTVTTAAASGAILEDLFTGAAGALTTAPTGGQTWYGNAQKDGAGNLVLGQTNRGYAAIDPATGRIRITYTNVVIDSTGSGAMLLAFGAHKTGSGGTNFYSDFGGNSFYWIDLHNGRIGFNYGAGNISFIQNTFTAQVDGTYTAVLDMDASAPSDKLVLTVNGTPMTLGAGDGDFFGGSFPPTGSYVGVFDSSTGGTPEADSKLGGIKVEVLP